MRITKELQFKLDNEQNKKRSILLKPLTETQEELIKQIKQEQIKTFEKIIEDYPIVQKILNVTYNRYRSNPDDITISQFVDIQYLNLCTPEQSKLLNKMNDKVTDQSVQCSDEFNRILIEISYGKNINDIKNIFEKYGLDF